MNRPATKKGHSMYDSEKKNYEGFFAWKPDRSESHCWGSTDRHDRTFGPPVQVHKDWYGNVTKVDRSWFWPAYCNAGCRPTGRGFPQSWEPRPSFCPGPGSISSAKTLPDL
jgi:hypothetical protein